MTEATAERAWTVRQDGEWTILHITAGGSETTSSFTQDEAQSLAAYLVQHHEPIEAHEAAARALASEEPDVRVIGTREELEASATMLARWAPETFPANSQGQIHFARAMMESAARTIRAFLAAQTETKDGPMIWCPISELKPDDGFVIVSPTDDDSQIPEVWSAKQYHLAMSPDRTPAFKHLHETAKLATHFMRLPRLPTARPDDTADDSRQVA